MSLTRRGFVKWACAGAGVALLPGWNRLAPAAETPPPGGASGGKPNLIMIYMDDMGYGDIAPFGSKKNRTPNLDRMASEGTRFTSFYAAPLCTASRTTLMTGCYAKRCSMPAVLFPVGAIGLSHSEKIIPEHLKPLGYATMCIGKWHLGDQPQYLPTRRGFDHYLGLPYSNDMGPGEANAAKKAKKAESAKAAPKRPPLPLLRDEKVIQEVAPKDQDRLVQIYTEEAVKFITANKDRPFFLYLPHTAVHNPYHPGDAFKGKSANGVYGDWVEESDWSVGRILDTIRSLGLAERTLVLFTSDNGGTKTGDNGPLRGFKGSTWEGGMREPTIAWWPGRVPAGRTCDEVACTMDVLPTFVHLAGGEVPAERVIDGRDFRPLLFNEPGAKSPHEAFYYFATGVGNLDAVRSGPWKYRLQPEKALYNLDKDIGEATDVAAANPEVVKRMQVFVDAMEKDLGVTSRGPGVRECDKVPSPRPLTLSGEMPVVE